MTKRKEHRYYSKDIPKKCVYCNEDFLAYRPNSKYCSDTCRYAWQARNQSEKSREHKKTYQKKWGTENWLRKRNYMIAYTYGITPEQYQELLEKQNYSCAICGKHETEFGHKLAIDHDHQTLEIYGLLCRTCNHTLIGKYRDPAIFHKAAEYLSKGTGWTVPPKVKKKRKKKHARRKRI